MERVGGPVRALLAGVAVVASLAVAGMTFGPVFTDRALWTPLAAVLVPVLVIDVLSTRSRVLSALRPLVAVGVALLALVFALGRSPTEAVRALPAAATFGWLRTLESTWPVHPEPELVGFVALMILVAAVLSVELVRRVSAPVALVPGVLVLCIGQAYTAMHDTSAILVALGYALAAAAVLACTQVSPASYAAASPGAAGRRWPVRASAVGLLCSFVAAGAAWAAVSTDPWQRPAYSLHEQHELAARPVGITNPLHEVADRLRRPDHVVFVNRTSASVDRWPLAVLDSYDGVSWASSARFRPMGQELEPNAGSSAAPAIEGMATVAMRDRVGPWLPVRFRLSRVYGTEVLVDAITGTMLSESLEDPQPAYELVWREPDVRAPDLADGALDFGAVASGIGSAPAAIVDLARTATDGAGPSIQTALQLERWLREHYQVATGDSLPTGHGYAQLQHFLTVSKRGTSEQFASAYAVLAHAVGIPVRLVAGFRQPAADPAGDHVVRNADVLAWPEVAVQGVGWVPLDPTAGAAPADADRGLATATEQVRKDLGDSSRVDADTPPSPQSPVDPPVAPLVPSSRWPSALGTAAAAILVGWLGGAPLVKRLRSHRRRRAAPAEAVIGAWREACDRLRDHRVTVGRTMTVRDLRQVAAPLVGTASDCGLGRLAECVDRTLWSGQRVDRAVAAEAWAGVDALRAALGGRPMGHRLLAAVHPRGLVGSWR